MKNVTKALTILVCLFLLALIFVPFGTAEADNPNLVSNPGFENGMAGYTTTYSSGPVYPKLGGQGEAGVSTNPKLFQSNFSSFTGEGNMLVINSASTSSDFICQDISVEQNKTYNFSVSSRSAYGSGSIPKHAWYINGSAITSIITAPSGSWATGTGTWNSGSATTARLCGRNISTGWTGADFAVDNLVLQPTAPVCTPHISRKCVGNSVYWFNSCSSQEEWIQTCSGNQTCNATTGSCVTSCTPHFSQKCVGNSVYWVNSCNEQEELKQTCSGNQTCNASTGSCSAVTCSSSTDCGTNAYEGSPFCQGNAVYKNYRTWTCNNAGTAVSSCSSAVNPQLQTSCSSNQTCSSGSCSNNNNDNGCSSHSYQQCSGNYLYWYDSCGNRQDVMQYCANGCSSGSCSNNNYYQNCTYHAYKDCIGNSVYWFNSCGNQQDIVQTCSGYNQTCRYGQCATNYNPVPVPTPTPSYIKYYRTGCYSNNLYWYDSNGSVGALYKNCADTNQCTQDICSSSKCQNPLKCDGTTCAIGSTDYCTACEHANDNVCNCGETSATAPNDCRTNASNLMVTFFGRKDITAVSWDKAVQVGTNGNVYFLAIIKNDSASPVENISVSALIPSEVSFLGNLKIDDLPIAGDIVSGVTIASISANATKTLTFEGKTQTFTNSGDKQATINVTSGGQTQSDSLTIILNPGQVAGVSTAPATSGFVEFLKRWYLWILVAIVLIFLFIVIFRRLSSNS